MRKKFSKRLFKSKKIFRLELFFDFLKKKYDIRKMWFLEKTWKPSKNECDSKSSIHSSNNK